MQKCIMKNGGILVKFCTTHICDELSAADLPLTKSDKAIIMQYLKKEIPMYAIWKQIREKYSDPTVRLHWISPGDIRTVMATYSSQRHKIEEPGVSSLKSSSTSVQRVKTEPDFDVSPIFAASLLEESSMSVDCGVEDDNGGGVSERKNGLLSVETPTNSETQPSCSSCVKLSETVARLESTAERLTKRIMELEEWMLHKKSIKEETE
ncbi:hypothetical protein COOONC_22296 [Cooperia oncophora]